MKFLFLGNYSNAGLSGFLKNPEDDRRAAISAMVEKSGGKFIDCLLYTSPSPRDRTRARMPSSA